MQLVDRNMHMFLSVKTHMYTNMSSIKLLYIISWKHHTHKDKAMHAHASFRLFWDVSSRFYIDQIESDVNSQYYLPIRVGCELPVLHRLNSMGREPALVIVSVGREPPLRSEMYAICLCFMLNNILYFHFHNHAFNTCFQYKP